MKKLLMIFSSLLLAGTVNAGILTLSGVYQGKNLYVQNPFTGNMKDFCTNDVYVNDKLVMSNIQSSAYEIDLSHLKEQEPVTVKITHKDDCKPKILNPQVIKATSQFAFSSFHVEKDKITWVTKGEKQNGKHFIEHFVNNSWVIVKEIPGKGSVIINSYNEPAVSHHSGLNKYRVKYLENDGQVFYSQVLEFVSDLTPVDFYPKRVTDKIYLSREAEFELLDAYGNVVRKGNQKEINMSDLTTGVYYLNVDNKTFKLFKK
ncbi:MAG: T9SS type A sorting domain-containing protein [Cytophagaceae bacterium]|nr:T9SS type A sorting domain-containing protein [Cytophagaceae bacterium]